MPALPGVLLRRGSSSAVSPCTASGPASLDDLSDFLSSDVASSDVVKIWLTEWLEPTLPASFALSAASARLPDLPIGYFESYSGFRDSSPEPSDRHSLFSSLDASAESLRQLPPVLLGPIAADFLSWNLACEVLFY